MPILETERLILREIDSAVDAEFILALLNSPGFLKYIGDRGIRTLEQSGEFIESRLRKSYADHGYGLYAVDLKSDSPGTSVNTFSSGSGPTSDSMGICGFVKRDGLPDADLGFAFLPQFEKKGYAFESANAVMEYGRNVLGLDRVLAITSIDNDASGRLLAKLGFMFDGLIRLPHSDEELKLFSSTSAA